MLDGRLQDRQLPLFVDVDICFSHNRFAHFAIMQSIARQLQVPLINLEHTLPPPNFNSSMLKYAKTMSGDVDVFISDYSRKAWGWPESDKVEIVHHGVDTELFKPDTSVARQDLVCSVVNDWMNRDWCCGFNLWRQVTGWPETTLPINVWGDTPGLSKAADGVCGLVKEYQRSSIFLNTSLISPVPTVLLEAMSCGCAIVSTNNCMIPEFITHGENGLLANDPRELRSHVDLLLRDTKLAEELGRKARETIVNRFSMEKFVDKWKAIFRKVL